MDPLRLLRQYHAEEKEVKVEGDAVVFDGVRFAKTAPTNFRFKDGKYPTLHTAVVFLQTHASDPSIKYVHYLAQSRKQGAPHVSMVDKKPLLNFLTGVDDGGDRIDTLAELPEPLPAPEAAQDAADR